MTDTFKCFFRASFFLLSLSLLACTKQKEKLSSEILWDTWGIPHIYATNNYDLYKLAGWAQMRNHADLLLKLYGESRGKSAEYWGTNLAQDKILQQLGLVENSKGLFSELTDEEQEMLRAFVDGINAFADRHPEELTDSLKVVLPILPEDVLAHASRVFYFEFLINRTLKKEKQFTAGSNAWAVAGKNTQNGSALLLANPHLPWYDFWLFFECQYLSPQNNLYGVTLIGMPTIGIGFNESLGWTHTVNTIDNVDFYRLELHDHQYQLDGQFYDFQTDTIYLKVKQQNSWTTEVLLRKKSIHGIVISENEENAIALRFANMDHPLNILRQWEAMGNAQSLNEFETALQINSLPLYNIIYADVAGNILFHLGGQIPKKNGAWEKWQAPVSGNTRNDIWTNYYNYNELPHTLNPPSGWLQNTNDAPFTNTLPPQLSPSSFPSNITPNQMSFRSQHSVKLLENTSKLTLETFIERKHDTHSELALRLKDDIEGLKTHTKDSLTLQAIEVLSNWDGSFDENSKGAVLFTNFINNLGGKSLEHVFVKEWSFENPLETPDGFADVEKVLEVLNKTALDQIKTIGSLEVNYGEIFRVKVGSYNYPANGGFGHLGLFRTLSFKPREDGKFYAYHGDGFVCATEFGSTIKAQALLSYGNATQSKSVHIGDQLELFKQKKLRPVWLNKEDHKTHLELKESLSDL